MSSWTLILNHLDSLTGIWAPLGGNSYQFSGYFVHSSNLKASGQGACWILDDGEGLRTFEDLPVGFVPKTGIAVLNLYIDNGGPLGELNVRYNGDLLSPSGFHLVSNAYSKVYSPAPSKGSINGGQLDVDVVSVTNGTFIIGGTANFLLNGISTPTPIYGSIGGEYDPTPPIINFTTTSQP